MLVVSQIFSLNPTYLFLFHFHFMKMFDFCLVLLNLSVINLRLLSLLNHFMNLFIGEISLQLAWDQDIIEESLFSF